MEAIVTTDWLNEQLRKGIDELRVVDVRFHLMDPDAGRKAYEEGHIPTAIYVDLNEHLSTSPSKHGGRHPLPSREQLAETFSHFGIDDRSKIVVYDEGGSFAARLYWTFKYLGHEDVAILDGGYTKWVQDGYEVTTEVPVFEKGTFTARNNDDWQTIDAFALKRKLNDPNTIIIDARERNRYLGLHEPIDPIAGHIPGAVNYFWKNVFDENGLWKSEAQLRELFADVPKDKEIVVYCGSGVSACPNIIALKRIGYKNVKLYPGSWSDWITYDDFPIETD